MIKAVVFDMDGLMFDTEKIGIRTWNTLSEELEYPKLFNLIYTCFGTNDNFKRKYFAEVLGEDFPYEHFRKREFEVTGKTLEEEGVPHKPGLVELLEYLKNNNIKRAVATSTPQNPALKHIKSAGVYDYFDVIITGDMTEKGKPEPDIYLKACKELGVDPEDAMGLEDSFNGIRAVFSAGMKAVMIPDMVQPDDEMVSKCFAIKESLSDVISLIDEINKN